MIERLAEAVAAARTGGVGVAEWSICAVERRRLALGTRDGETGNVHAPLSLSETLGARYVFVWDDGRVSRGSLDKRQMLDGAAEAVALARTAAYDDPDAARVCAPAAFPEVALFDAAVARIAGGDTGVLEARLDSVRDRVRRHGCRTWSGSIAAAEVRSRLATSRGVDVEESGTSAGWHVTLEGEWSDGFAARALEPDDAYGRRLDRLAETVELLGRPAPATTAGVHPVLLHPNVVESFVIETLLHNLDGATVAHDEGHFRRDDFGADRPVLREDLSLALDPLEPLRSGSYRFTVEGVPAARCAFVERGRLITPILDLKHAHRLGLDPTPSPAAMDTLALTASRTLEFAEACARAAGGVMVLSVLGVHTQDPASGDFSLSAPQMLGLATGGPEGRLRGTISGNLFEVLRHDALELVGFEGESTPGMLFPCRVDPTS